MNDLHNAQMQLQKAYAETSALQERIEELLPAQAIVDKIDARLGKGWTRELADCLADNPQGKL